MRIVTEITKRPETGTIASNTLLDHPQATPAPVPNEHRDVVPRVKSKRLSNAYVVATIVWVCVGIGLAVALVVRILGYPALGEGVENFVTYSSPAGAAFIIGATTLVGIVAKLFRPQSVLAAVLAAGLLLILAATISTGRIGALLAAFAVMAMATLLGRCCLSFLSLPALGLSRLVISCATGLGLFGLVGFVLGYAGALNTVSVAACAVGILGASWFLWQREGKHSILRDFRWDIAEFTWLETVLAGVVAGLVVFASLSALAPEVMFDPFRQHLPIAETIWQSQSLRVIPYFGVSRDPVLGHLLFAIAIGRGDVNAAILLNMMIGIGCLAALAATTYQVAGRSAAVVGLAAYATMPLALWEMGHAYTDLFPVFFSLVSLHCALLWQRDGRSGWLVLAGLAAASGFAAKLTAVWVLIPLALGIFIIGRRPWNLRERIVASLWFSAGALAALPWFVRTLFVFGGLPAKLALFIESALTSIPGVHVAIQQQVESGFNPIVGEVGIGHAVLDVVRVPFLIAFASDKYPDQAISSGDLGIILPLLIPFVLLIPRTRSSLLIALSVGVSYAGWWLSPLQATRHLLPTLAFLAILVGAGVASSVQLGESRRNALTRSARVALGVGVILAPLLLVSGRMSQVPIDVIVGRVSAEEYVDREIPAASELARASEMFPPHAPLLYIGKWGGAQLYTTARLVNAGQLTQESLDEQFGQDEDDILRTLEGLGVSAFIWDRPTTKPEDATSSLLSLAFLSQHTRVIASSNDYMLFSIVPNGSDYWIVDPATTLVRDPEFETIKTKKSVWESGSRVAQSGGVIAPRRDDIIHQQIDVTGGTSYVMVASTSCPDYWSRTTLALRWLDVDGQEISRDSQVVFAGSTLNDQFIYATAPEGATYANVEFGGQSRCEFSRVDVFAQPPAS